MIFNKIQTKIWELSVSTGTPPYTFISFKVDEELKNSVAEEFLSGYTQGIAFFIWDDYTLNDYKDYVINSKEYSMIADNQKESFLEGQIKKNIEKNSFQDWKRNQMYIALGFSLNVLRSENIPYREAENIVNFQQTLKINKAVLSDIILF
ncbi:hypothetical protein [Chryseobacterium tongliaoense]|uniref:hypothetical protein n=1 Tax=Chryseobacterium tongliaoense TaxID=3240933 RepID=UPI0035175895